VPATVPGHGHTFWQADTLVSPSLTRSFFRHEGPILCGGLRYQYDKDTSANSYGEEKANMIFCDYGDAILPGDDTGFGWSGAYGGGYGEHLI